MCQKTGASEIKFINVAHNCTYLVKEPISNREISLRICGKYSSSAVQEKLRISAVCALGRKNGILCGDKQANIDDWFHYNTYQHRHHM